MIRAFTNDLRCNPKSTLWMFLCLSWSPGIIGHNWIPICILLALIWFHLETAWLQIKASDVGITILCSSSSIYLLARGFILGDGREQVYINTFLIAIFSFFIMSIGLRLYTSIEILKAFTVLMVFLCISIILSYAIYGFTFGKPLIEFAIRKYDSSARFYFPLTCVYPQTYDLGIINNVNRTMGIFREPGLFQAFLNTAIVCSAIVFKKKNALVILMLLIVGVVSTMSTAGLASLFISIPAFLFIYLKKGSPFRVIVIGAIVVIVLPVAFKYAMNLDAVGFASKINNDSGADRVDAVKEFLTYWKSAGIWGLNGISDSGPESVSGTILLYFVYYGIFGISLFVLQYLYFFCGINWILAIIVMLPLMLTGLTSQPIAGTLPTYLIAYAASRFNKNERK